VKEGKYDFTPKAIWSNIHDDTKDLIKQCLTMDEHSRPDMWGVMGSKAMSQAEASGAVYIASTTLGRQCSQAKKFDKDAEQTVNKVKTAFSMIAEVITDSQVLELRAHFKTLDVANTGMVELKDSVEKIMTMIKDNHNQQAKDLFELLNTDGISGVVNYYMYIATLSDRRKQLRREASRAVFNSLDIDKNGEISLYEITQALNKHDDPCGVIELKGKTGLVSVLEVHKIWNEMRTVFLQNEEGKVISVCGLDRSQTDEFSFESFFKSLPNSKHDSGF